MRVAVVDVGTNSTRLLVADVEGDAIAELDRRRNVTRLGEGVNATAELGQEPIDRVLATLNEYRSAIDEHGARARSEEHTSELLSRLHLVCRLLLEKKKPLTQPDPH